MTEQPPIVIQKTVELSGPWPALAQLEEQSGLDTQTLTQAAAKGALWWSAAQAGGQFKKPVRIRLPDERVSNGDKLLLNYNADVLAAVPAVPVLVSDQVNYSVWCKPAGVLSQGTKWSDHCSMPFLVEQQHNKRAFLVHRLDRAASGLMVLAHTKNALVKLTGLFSDRKVEKTYQAVVHGSFDKKLPLLIDTPVEEKTAHTEVVQASIDETNSNSRLVVNIKTGRKHQIRSHLSSVGYPIVGDRLFDAEREHKQDLQLVSVIMAFDCPFTEKRVCVELPENLNPLV